MSWFLAEFSLIQFVIFESILRTWVNVILFVCLFFILGGKVASKEKCPNFRSPEVDIYITMDFGL